MKSITAAAISATLLAGVGAFIPAGFPRQQPRVGGAAVAASSRHRSAALGPSAFRGVVRPRSAALDRTTMMAEEGGGGGGGESGGGGGGGGERQREKQGKSQTMVKDRVKEVTKAKNKEKLDKEGWWRVLLHNDNVHTFDYVTFAIVKVVKQLSRKKAHQITMTTHKSGVATVTVVWKNKAEQYCLGLQQCGLTASIAPDKQFKKNSEGGEGGGGGGGDGPSTE